MVRGAVSVLKILGPRLIGIKPCFSAQMISSLANPPSGPIIISTDEGLAIEIDLREC